MNKIKTIIVDDEKAARNGLSDLLGTNPKIEIVAVCENGLEAIEIINNNTVELAFLDIQMPGINGFEILNSIERANRPFVIFTTAYDEYALKAFDYHALDYLLKPFSDKRLEEAIEIASSNITNDSAEILKNNVNRLLDKIIEDSLKSNSQAKLVEITQPKTKRLIIKTTSRKIVFIDHDDIEWIEAYDYYIKIHKLTETYIIKDSLKKMESKLPFPEFIRVHKSSMVNSSHIKEISSNSKGDYIITLISGQVLKTGRKYRENIKILISQL